MKNTSTPDELALKIPHRTLLIGAISTLVIVIIVCVLNFFDVIKIEIRDIIALITCGIVSTTLVYHAKNLKLNYDINNAKLNFDKEKWNEEKSIRKEESQKNKNKYSYESSMLWFRPDMVPNVERARSYLKSIRDTVETMQVSEIIETLDKDIELQMALNCVLNYFENLSILIENGIVEEEIIKTHFKTAFVDYIKVLRKYIDHIQHKSKRYLVNYEKVADRWAKN